ncbi:hypothetical protein BDV97DRAFT_368582 [Delphinella strobiligena]|nr:hypothetical protein BDV97DRAFT_368582 [Delphinella strobiligena]
MGLPIWNYADDEKEDKAIKESSKNDGTAASRSTIRRHPSIHGRRGNARADGTNEVVDVDGLRASRHRITDTPAALDNDENPPPVPDPVSNSNSNTRSRDASTSIQLRGGTHGFPIVARHASTTFSLRDDAPSRLDVESAGRMNHRHRRYETALARTRRHVRRRDGSDRWIPPPSEHARPQSPHYNAHRNNLPTPPLDTSILPSPSDILARSESRQVNDMVAPSQDQDPPPQHDAAILPSTDHIRPRYPYVWPRDHDEINRALSSDNGLGDRRRSLSSSADVWQVMRNTITPDDSLPSTSSSFTSAAAADASFHDNHQTAATHIRGEASHDRDTSFEQAMHDVTMYHTDSSEAIGSDHDDSGHDDQSITSDSDDNTSDNDDDSDGMEDEEQEQRRHIALQLYDLAMATPEGREQIESLRRPTTSQNPLPTPDSSLPLPEPQQFGTEVHDRAQEATSQTRTFFTPGDGMTQEEYEEESARFDRASNHVDDISRMLDTLREEISLSEDMLQAPSDGARTRELNQTRDATTQIDRMQHSRTRVTDILQSQLDGTDDTRTRSSTRVTRRPMATRRPHLGPDSQSRPPLRGMVARRSRPTRGGRHTETRAEGEARVLHL